MNNKKNINEEYNKENNNEESSFNDFKNYNKNKEIFNVLNKKKIISKNIYKRIQSKYDSKILNISNNEKNRNIKRKNEKEKYEFKNTPKSYNPYPFKKGNVFCFLYINNYPIFTLGPQYYYPIMIISFNNTLFFLFIKYAYQKINFILQFFSLFLLIIVDITQLFTVFINPGIPKKIWFLSDKIINLIMKNECIYKEFNTEKYKICRKCNLLIDKCLKIIHCDICDVCCEKYDHHCPWIGKCIGKNNYYSFKFFVISNILYILLQIIILFIYLIKNYYY